MAFPGLYRVIVVALDGRPAGLAAAGEAAVLARLFESRLFAVSVIDDLPRGPALMAEVDDLLHERARDFHNAAREARRIAAGHMVVLHHEIRIGRLVDAIVRFVDEVDADLVVLGCGRARRVVWPPAGVTARMVEARTRASVLIVKAGVDASTAWLR